MGRSSKLQAGANRARGIAEVSVSDIMQAVGMTSGGFYKHFASREAQAVEAARLAFDRSDSTGTASPAIVRRSRNGE